MKIGISLLREYSIPTSEIIRLIKDVGFDAVSPAWTEDVCVVIETAKSYGLEIQSLHASYGYAVGMWRESEVKYVPAKAEIMEALEICRKYAIPTLVTHVWLGFEYTFGETKFGIQHYGDIIAKAKEYGVKIAFENTEGEEYLFTLLDHFKDDTVGFCWDSGHELCYNRSKDLLAMYGDRLYMTHLNDNMGMTGERIFWTDDLHLLPFDGKADWDYNISRLKKARKQDIINFELKPSERYNDMSYEEYFKEAYRKAKEITDKY